MTTLGPSAFPKGVQTEVLDEFSCYLSNSMMNRLENTSKPKKERTERKIAAWAGTTPDWASFVRPILPVALPLATWIVPAHAVLFDRTFGR